jgi:small-conductance mechanosensitive channel
MWMPPLLSKPIFRRIINLLILFLASWLLILNSMISAQTIGESFGDTGSPVVVDGIPLFELQAVNNFSARDRTRFVNNSLAQAIATNQVITFDIHNDEKAQATSISLNDNYLLTITSNDVLPGFSPTEQATQWRTLLEQAIARAKKERTPQYFWQRLLWIGMAIGGLILIQFLLGMATRIFKFKTGILSKVCFGMGWLAIAIISSHWFPFLRSLSYQLLSPLSQPQWLLFFGAIGISVLLSYYAADLTKLILKKVFPHSLENIYKEIIEPSDRLLKLVVLGLSINWSLDLLEPLAPVLYNLFKPIVNIGLIISLYWFSIKLVSRYLRTYGFKLGSKFSPSSDDAVLVLETVFNILISIAALVALASSLNFDLIGLVASLGLVGLAVAFAAQKILEQLIATLVLYLDRPFVTGDYIRLPGGELGKVESIGLRSTKIRSLGTGTIIVMPNSILVSVEIENVTLAKKIMVLLYMNFADVLGEREYALVQQVIADKTAYLSGIDPSTTHITQSDGSGKRLRVSFAILGSQDNAIEVRKRLLQLASAEIAKSLSVHGIVFTMEDPTVYMQSPVTI